jgi:hypothetical protein
VEKVMEKMYFEIVEDEYKKDKCHTSCPYVPKKYIGSIGCGWCDFHVVNLDDPELENNFIFCKYKKLKGIGKTINIIKFIICFLISLMFSYLGYISFEKNKFAISFVCFLISFVFFSISDKTSALGKINKQNEPTKDKLFRQ